MARPERLELPTLWFEARCSDPTELRAREKHYKPRRLPVPQLHRHAPALGLIWPVSARRSASVRRTTRGCSARALRLLRRWLLRLAFRCAATARDARRGG